MNSQISTCTQEIARGSLQNIAPTRPTQPHMWATCGSHNPTRPHHPRRGCGWCGTSRVGSGEGLKIFASSTGNRRLANFCKQSVNWGFCRTATKRNGSRMRDDQPAQRPSEE